MLVGTSLAVAFSVAATAIISIIYHLLPYRSPERNKPSFAMFPKYKVPYKEGTLQDALVELKFVPSSPNVYERGKWYGDGSTSVLRLRITVDPRGKQFYLASPYAAILFDTGDLWVLVDDIRNRMDNV